MSAKYSTDRYHNVHIQTTLNTTPRELQQAIETQKLSAKRGIFVEVPELALGVLLTTILQNDFKFHHYLNGEYCYYIWNNQEIEDKVPEFATSIEGIAALVLSPDQTEILLVWEYNKWKPITGAVESGHSLLKTLAKEVHEEVSVELDPDFEPRYLGGWNYPAARYHTINDNLFCFAVRALSKNFQVDGVEIKQAQWFPLADFYQFYDNPELNNYLESQLSNNLLRSVVSFPNGLLPRVSLEQNRFAYYLWPWLQNYREMKYYCLCGDQSGYLIH
jgi:8-oxo-dGTP pyrophosphatase MutT (NUDIX family)